ncbi:SynChlorMet cassette protein ScmD [Candidatus Fermentibacteria bacterium]|nr:SynChlorMet cassette protein ScmD [Candidatus Fermentibacteria bacterium]
MSESTVPRANPRIILREEFDDWAVLFDPDTGEGFGIDPVAVFYWKRLDGVRTKSQLLDELRQECTDVPDDAPEHLDAFIARLERRGLLSVDEDAAAES